MYDYGIATLRTLSAVKVKERVSLKIANMSLLCAVLVACIHIPYLNPSPLAESVIDSLLKYGLAAIAVPWFFIVSGWFLAVHFEEENWWGNALKKRCSSIIVPFFFWLIIAAIVTTPLYVLADYVAHRPLDYSLPFLHGKGLAYFGGDFSKLPGLGQFWYLRSLMLFVLISPALKWLIRKLGGWWLAVAFALMTLNGVYQMRNACDGSFICGFLKYGFSVVGLFYFSVGIYLKLYPHAEIKNRWILSSMFLIGFVLLCLKYYGWFNLIPLNVLFVPCLLLAIYGVMPAVKLPSVLVKSSFAIFIMHQIVLHYFTVFVRATSILLPAGVMYVVQLVVAVTVSILIWNMLRHSFPRMAKFLFGGRV